MVSHRFKRELEELYQQIGSGEYDQIPLTALYGYEDRANTISRKTKDISSHLPKESLSELQDLSDQTPRCESILNPYIGFEFWLSPARVRVLYGGRSSSKSWDAATWAIYLAHATRKKFLCVRQLQNKIEESVYTLLKHQIIRMGLSHQFTITNNKISHNHTGSSFVFYGLWRHIDELRSMEGIDVCWIEEAHNLTEEQWQILEPTIRKQGSEFWIIFNPILITDFIYQRFIIHPQETVLTKKINYTDNPYLSETILEVIQRTQAEDEDAYNHIYLGEPRNDDDDAIIKRAWVLAAINAHETLDFTPRGEKRVGFDIADAGGDRCVNVFAHGTVVTNLDVWKANEDELIKSCQRAYRNASDWEATRVTFDSIGVGAMAGEKLREIQGGTTQPQTIRFTKFNAGSGVTNPEKDYAHSTKNKDMFSNAKAQAWWTVADLFRNTYNAIKNNVTFDDDQLISISIDTPHLEQLVTELCTPKKKTDKAGRVVVESKEELAKRGYLQSSGTKGTNKIKNKNTE